MKSKANIQAYLEQQLHKAHAFWSYDKKACHNLSDENLIKYVLIHLDLEDINLLFAIYSKRRIKRVWLDELVPQGDYLTSMNHCFAVLYFDIKRPSRYLKAMETRHFNKIVAKYG